jgi:hypothetical protein
MLSRDSFIAASSFRSAFSPAQIIRQFIMPSHIYPLIE